MKNKISILLIIFLSTIHLFAAQAIEIEADSIKYMNKEKNIFAKGNVKVLFENMVLKANKAVYNSKVKKFQLTGQIKLTNGKIKMTCDEITASKIDKTIIGDGNINFDYEGNINITCGNVIYQLEDQKIFFNNNVVVTQLKNKMKTDKIVLDLKKEELQTIGKTKVKIKE